jgi:hypothetical protein
MTALFMNTYFNLAGSLLWVQHAIAASGNTGGLGFVAGSVADTGRSQLCTSLSCVNDNWERP